MTDQAPISPPPPSAEGAEQHRHVRRAVGVFLVVVLTIAALIFFTHLKVPPLRKARVAGDYRGKPAPDFALKDLSGKTVHLSDYRGKAVVLNFWATWCPPCVEEIPTFVAMQNQYGPQGLEVVGIAMDDDASPSSIGRFAREEKVNYTLLIGSDAVADAYGGIDALPTTFYIDREGRMMERVFGAGAKSEIEESVKKVLDSGKHSGANAAPEKTGTAVVGVTYRQPGQGASK